MQPTFTFRHFDGTPGIEAHASEKLEKLAKYWFKPESAHFILWVEKHHEHCAELTFVDHGERFISHASSNDMYASIDMALHKLEAQLRKKKDRHTHHKGHASASGLT
jgi:putative sigma-54 modulation protein